MSWNSNIFSNIPIATSHTLTGVWVEIPPPHLLPCWKIVTPSRVCELKFFMQGFNSHENRSHPHGCVSWNPLPRLSCRTVHSHTLTGVWVEIYVCNKRGKNSTVTPSRVCELKSSSVVSFVISKNVTPSRVCELKCRRMLHPLQNFVTPSRVCELKSAAWRLSDRQNCHTLTGVWVEIKTPVWAVLHWPCHTLTGVWVEICWFDIMIFAD